MPRLYPVFDMPSTSSNDVSKNTAFRSSAYFDMDGGDIALDGAGRVRMASGRDAYRQWCMKLLHTQRGQLYAYPSGFGIELSDALGRDSRADIESALAAAISDALIADPARRTLAVDSFAFEWNDSSLGVSFRAIAADGRANTVSTSFSV